MRGVRAAAATAVTALLLTGCAIWESAERAVTEVYSAVVARQLLNELTDELQQRDDVVSAESAATAVDMTASVTVTLNATAPRRALADVASRVAETLRSEELQPFGRQFSVQRGESGIHQTSFGNTTLDFAAEIAHWVEVQSAVGVELAFELRADGTGVVRVLTATTDAIVAAILENYDAISALRPPSNTETMWRVPGVMGNADRFGPLPERRILSLLAEMAEVTNLLDSSLAEEPPGFSASLPVGSPPRFTLVANAHGSEVDAATTGQLTLHLTLQAIATGLSQFQVSVQTYAADSVDTASFHVGQCADASPPTPADQELVDTLTAAGVALPVGAAGGCLVFEPAS